MADLTATDLSGSVGSDTLDPVYTQDPGLSPQVRREARRATRTAITPYQQAMALQDYFRNGFEYNTEVDYREEPDPVLAFIQARKGFCQQFASTFALMARSLGLPARVAVGFTQGDSVAQLPGTDGAAGFVVRGRHAHAWPEVYFDGVGWVPFEPTTGRGNPQATTYTGVAPEQADPPPAQAATTTIAPSTTPGGPVRGHHDDAEPGGRRVGPRGSRRRQRPAAGAGRRGSSGCSSPPGSR